MANIQVLDGTETTSGRCFCNKTHLTWKIRIKSCDTSIELVYYKLFPRKYLYVNGLLRETVTNVFGRFRYFFYVQGHHIQLEYENSSYSLYINKKPLSYYIENYNKEKQKEKAANNKALEEKKQLDNKILTLNDIQIKSKALTMPPLNPIKPLEVREIKENPIKSMEIHEIKENTLFKHIENHETKENLIKNTDLRENLIESPIKAVESSEKRKESPIKTIEIPSKRKESPCNVKEKIENSNKNCEILGKPHLLKLKDPVEIQSIAKNIENDVDTPQRNPHKKNNRMEINRDTDTDSLMNGLFENSNEKILISDLNTLKTKLENIQLKSSDQKQTPEQLSSLLTKLQKIRSKLFWMSNTYQEEAALTNILYLNDFLNKLFDKLLVTPEPPRPPIQETTKNPIESPKKACEKNMKETSKFENDEELCIICLELKVSHACIPCGHLKYCEKCVKIIVDRNECAVCRSKVQSVYKIFT